MTQKSVAGPAKPTSSAPQKKTTPTASKGTAREAFMKELSQNPRFKEAGKSGEAFVIVGAKKP
jgi:hypothetical protein